MTPSKEEIIRKAYHSFNHRDADAIMPLLHEAVEWPNGWEGGYLGGREAVKAYWLRQWKEINPDIEPLFFLANPDASVEVRVRQVVTGMDGQPLVNNTVLHTYFFSDGLIKRMEITQPAQTLSNH